MGDRKFWTRTRIAATAAYLIIPPLCLVYFLENVKRKMTRENYNLQILEMKKSQAESDQDKWKQVEQTMLEINKRMQALESKIPVNEIVSSEQIQPEQIQPVQIQPSGIRQRAQNRQKALVEKLNK